MLLGPAPQITAVTVSGAPVRAPQPFVVSGTLSRSAPWTAALRDPDGKIVLQSAGDSASPRLEWSGLRAPPGTDLPAVLPALPGRYTWAIRVDDGHHPADRREEPFEVSLPVVPG